MPVSITASTSAICILSSQSNLPMAPYIAVTGSEAETFSEFKIVLLSSMATIFVAELPISIPNTIPIFYYLHLYTIFCHNTIHFPLRPEPSRFTFLDAALLYILSTNIRQTTFITIWLRSGCTYFPAMLYQTMAEVAALLRRHQFPQSHLHLFRIFDAVQSC